MCTDSDYCLDHTLLHSLFLSCGLCSHRKKIPPSFTGLADSQEWNRWSLQIYWSVTRDALLLVWSNSKLLPRCTSRVIALSGDAYRSHKCMLTTSQIMFKLRVAKRREVQSHESSLSTFGFYVSLGSCSFFYCIATKKVTSFKDNLSYFSFFPATGTKNRGRLSATPGCTGFNLGFGFCSPSLPSK